MKKSLLVMHRESRKHLHDRNRLKSNSARVSVPELSQPSVCPVAAVSTLGSKQEYSWGRYSVIVAVSVGAIRSSAQD